MDLPFPTLCGKNRNGQRRKLRRIEILFPSQASQFHAPIEVGGLRIASETPGHVMEKVDIFGPAHTNGDAFVVFPTNLGFGSGNRSPNLRPKLKAIQLSRFPKTDPFGAENYL